MGDLVLSFLLILPETLTVFFLARSFASLKRPKLIWWALLVAALLIDLEQSFMRANGVSGTLFHTVFIIFLYTSFVCYLFTLVSMETQMAHLAILRDMARRNAPQEEFSAYLNSMLEIDIPGVLYINTHRTVVDVIISEKVPVAKEKGIDFQFQLDDLTDFPMPDDALVVVLTNLIDNAIEACGKIPQAADRHIWMRMNAEKQSALMCIDNTTAEPVVIRDNMVQTTKEDTLAHGYGLKNVAAMIERSGGMYFIEYDAADKKFRFTASLPMKTE